MNMRYEVLSCAVWTSAYRQRHGARQKISYRVMDMTALDIHSRPVAWCDDEATARRIADMMNGTNLHASHWKAQVETARTNALELEKRWQGCLDVANRNAAAARADAAKLLVELAEIKRDRGLHHLLADIFKDERDRLRNQLFETREQRDDAREANKALSKTLANMPIGWTAEEIANLMQERDAARAAPTADALSKAAAQLLIALTLTQVGEGRGWNDVDAALKAVREQLK